MSVVSTLSMELIFSISPFSMTCISCKTLVGVCEFVGGEDF